MQQIRKTITVSASEDAEIIAAYADYLKSSRTNTTQNDYLKMLIFEQIRRH